MQEELPPLISSRVGPQVVEAMAQALDDIMTVNVHSEGCEDFRCSELCPTRIAVHAVRRISLLTNLAMVAP